jgi:tetratricopeptide (TPR) repeat protein
MVLAMPLEIPELTMGPCRDFGQPGLEEVARMPPPTALSAHVKGIVGKLQAEGIMPAEEAIYLSGLVDTMAVAPGYAKFLDEEKKQEKALRLYDISQRLSSVTHPLKDDLLLAIGIVLFNLSPSEKLFDTLSGLKPCGLLSYEYNSMMALNELMKGRLDEADSYADSALESARDQDGRSYVNMLKGCIELRRGDPESAIGYLDDCNANRRLSARASFYAGIVRYERQDYREALKRFESAGEGAGDELDVLAVKCNVGACALNLGDMGRGEKEFRDVNRSTWKKSGSREVRRKLLANSYMGIISRATGRYPEAENYYKEALKSCVRLNDTVGIANQIGNMGLLHRHAGDTSTALRLFNACLVYSERMGTGTGYAFHARTSTGPWWTRALPPRRGSSGTCTLHGTRG